MAYIRAENTRNWRRLLEGLADAFDVARKRRSILVSQAMFSQWSLTDFNAL
jgi:hypothetical protein